MKKCTKCGEIKNVDDFKLILQRGKRVRQARCAKCVAVYKREHYLRNQDKIKERARKWSKDNPERVKERRRKYYEENKEKLKQKQKEYNSRSEVKERNAKRFREYRKDPEYRMKESARSAVNHAIRDGKLTNPNRCSKCGKDGYSEAHHEDYNKALEVVWLCKQCHEDIHHSNEGHNSLE